MRWVLLILAAVAGCATPEGDDYHATECEAVHDARDQYAEWADHRDEAECES